MYAIQTNLLTKYYGKTRGIQDLNLIVEKGDFFGFIGPNGAGKSTTIRTLLGLISPSRGSAELLGHDIQANKISFLSKIGYLPSETTFYRGMRVKEILSLSAQLYGKDCSAQAKELCERFELDPTKKAEQLSLGNRKKVGIICAMQHEPELYIMDEPTSGLDPFMQKEFFSLLKERNQKGATIFLSSHVLSEVQKYCHHAAVIRDGSILISDSVDRLGHTEAKRITLRGTQMLPQLDSIKDVQQSDNMVSFLYSGKPEYLLKELSKLPLTDITITEPDLEEVFMHYYAKEELNHADL